MLKFDPQLPLNPLSDRHQMAESNGKLLLGIWRDSLHVTCGLTACTPGSAPGLTLGNEYGKTLPFTFTSEGRGSEGKEMRGGICRTNVKLLPTRLLLHVMGNYYAVGRECARSCGV